MPFQKVSLYIARMEVFEVSSSQLGEHHVRLRSCDSNVNKP